MATVPTVQQKIQRLALNAQIVNSAAGLSQSKQQKTKFDDVMKGIIGVVLILKQPPLQMKIVVHS